MWQRSWIIAWRNLWRQRNYTLINVLGMAVSIAACLLLFRLVRYERSFDRHHTHFDRIVRVITQGVSAEETNYTPGVPLPAMDAIQSGVPQFEQFARLHSFQPQITVPTTPGSPVGQKFDTDEMKETAACIEPAFFRIFDWKWLAGDPVSCLTAPNDAVLTQSTAEKCFGNWQTAVGKTILLDNTVEVSVKGVIANPPDNSDFPFNLLVAYETLRKYPDLFGYFPEWGSNSSNDQVWALLGAADQFGQAETLLAGIGKEEYKNHHVKVNHVLQPLAKQHFDDQVSHLGTHSVTQGRLLTLSLIGLLILVMACFNFINLATAQASSRSKEIGVRKTLGSSRQQLIVQFLGETALTVVFAVVLGAGLASLLAPLLGQISDVPDALPFLTDPVLIGFLVVLTFGMSLFAGFYPALVLAGFDPAEAIKNKISTHTIGGVSLRKALVFTQFCIAQALIIGTLVAVSQMNYIQNMDLGFKPDLVYTISGLSSDSVGLTRLESFKTQLLQNPAVESVSFGSDVPSSGNNWYSNFAYGRSKEDAPFSTSLKMGDADYLKTYGLRLVAGRTYAQSDTVREYVVNMTLLRKLGVTDPQEAIGQEIRLGGSPWKPIVGVVDDFHASSARDQMRPVVIACRKKFYDVAGIKIRPENMAATTAAIKQTFDVVFPEKVYSARYFDEGIAEFYRDEDRFAAITKSFALLAIFISCLGLFGLASLLAAQKTKEIGIRKVLGASVTSVVGLLSKDFLLLVLLAFLAAAPLAWWGMRLWLENFVFRTDIAWWIYAGTAITALAVAFFTISFQAVRAAVANPVNSLRNE